MRRARLVGDCAGVTACWPSAGRGDLALERRRPRGSVPPGRSEVVFWHFWGGKDRPVVEDIVERFNASQNEYFVRPIAMPGNNLDLKFFLSVAGGDPPDVVNQDDPIVADWAQRDAIMPLDELASGRRDRTSSNEWLFPAARQIGSYQGRLYALCNGLDIRALYYNATMLEAARACAAAHARRVGCTRPWRSRRPIARRRASATATCPIRGASGRGASCLAAGFTMPTTGRVTADSEPIVAALDWMASYSRALRRRPGGPLSQGGPGAARRQLSAVRRTLRHDHGRPVARGRDRRGRGGRASPR